MMTPPPKRRIEVMIRISGDSWDDITREGNEIANHLEQCGIKCASVSGGVSSGHFITVTEYPEQTPEKFKEDIKKWRLENGG